MAIVQGIVDTYAQFFDWHMWVVVLSDPVSWGLIGTLVLMEGLLSADNALVLAVMVRHLPEHQRRNALFFGLLGAYTFRFIAIGIGVFLIELWWVKVLGAAYLAWLSIKYFKDKGNKNNDSKRMAEKEIQDLNKNGIVFKLFGNFWGTVASVELMDLAFSIDSVLAAFGISEVVWILLLGGILGVLMMRGIAGIFVKLIDRIPEVETTAYVLIMIIAIKMALAVVHIEMEHIYFFILILFVFGLTFVVHFRKQKKESKLSVAKDNIKQERESQ
jgi:YkoY family integral membrane protein